MDLNDMIQIVLIPLILFVWKWIDGHKVRKAIVVQEKEEIVYTYQKYKLEKERDEKSVCSSNGHRNVEQQKDGKWLSKPFTTVKMEKQQ